MLFLYKKTFIYQGMNCIFELSSFSYRAINISIERMREIITTITGKEELVKFTKPILKLPKIDELFLILHQLILENKDGLNREELLYFFIDALIAHAADIKIEEIAFSEASKENLLLAKSYLEKNFASTVSLEELSRRCHLNKYTLIRYFTKYFGVAPYQYLQTIRIKEAKELLSNDKELLSISLKVGFSDQSHFTRVFKSLIGITPKQYQGIFKQ
ncbi:AraC family transcriptional regulator [Tetragenococcus halophilus]